MKNLEKILPETAKAAKEYCNKRFQASQDAPFIDEGFRQGAKWAIEEFLKNLWHDAKDAPKIGGYILMEMDHGRDYSVYRVEHDVKAWERIRPMLY